MTKPDGPLTKAGMRARSHYQDQHQCQADVDAVHDVAVRHDASNASLALTTESVSNWRRTAIGSGKMVGGCHD